MSRLVWTILRRPVTRPAGLLTAPVPGGGTLRRERPPSLCVCGVRVARGCLTGEGGACEARRLGGGAPPPPQGKGKEKRERIIVVVRSPCQENYPADAHPSALKSVLESANPAWTRSVYLDAPGQRDGQQPVSGTAEPGVVKQDKSSRGSVDTTKTRSDPQRVRMSPGERPIGAAKGKQSDTEALCQPPPPPQDPPPTPAMAP